MSVILQITSSSNEEKENRDEADDRDKRAPKAIAETSTVSSSLSHVLTGINTGKGAGNMVDIVNEQSTQRNTGNNVKATSTTRAKTAKVVFDENVKMEKHGTNKEDSSADHTAANSLVRPTSTSNTTTNAKNSNNRRKSTNSNASTNNCAAGEDESSSSSTRIGRSTSKSQQNTASSRMLPFNDRLRNMFELFRSRLNTNPSPSGNKCVEPPGTNKHHRNGKTAKKSSQTNTKQKQTSTNNNNKNVPEISTTSANFTTQHPQNQKSQSTDSSGMETCELCLNPCQSTGGQHPDTAGVNYLYQLETCEHSFCVNCLRQYLKYQITESRVSISCPQCSEKMHPSDIYRLLLLKIVVAGDTASACSSSSSSSAVSPLSTNSLLTSEQKAESAAAPVNTREWSQLIDKYEEFALRRALVSIPDTRWCPAPDCTYAVIASGCANCPQLHCLRPNCNTSFCYHCKQYWHPNLTCEDAALRQNQNAILNSGLIEASAANILIGSAGGSTSANGLLRSILGRSNSHISSTSSTNAINSPSSTMFTSRNVNGDWIKEEIKRCPKCQALIVKMDDGSCNHITCSVCGCEFCWLCMKEISDLHYLSPSGCTFWGKKPWSRKKKILWQLGTLIGAPVGIALIAGVAVPAILIGLPIWAGRKVYIRYKNIGKHKRNFIVIGTVVGTIVVAPLVAALAVGIGVPILLAYVYGVVPISLCRSGGCGVTTNNNGGVRFAFDDETTDNQSYFNNTSNNQIPPTTTATTTTTANTNTPSTSAAQNEKIGTSQQSEKSASNGKSSSRQNSFFLNSVTIPISAIGSKADSIIVSTLSNSNEDVTKGSQPVAAGSGAAAAPTATNTAASQSQTPLFVTITMGNKATSNSITYSSCAGSNQLIKGRHQRIRYRSSSSSSSHRLKRSSSLNNKKRTKTSNIASIMNSVSVACGTVETTNNSKTANGKRQTISLLDEDVHDEGQKTPDRTMASETGTASCYLKSDKEPSVGACCTARRETNLKNLISNRIVNNPSIGETSIGVASYNGDEYNSGMDDLDYIEEVLQSAAARQNRAQNATTGNVLTNHKVSSGKHNNNNNNTNSRVVKIIKKNTTSGRKSTDLENEDCYEQMEDHSDRDSASNRALAGDLGTVGNKHSTNSSSVRLNFDKKSLNKDESDYKMDVKSNYTINSYEKTVSSLMADADAYSVSILSEKSINPSVAALVGSIKDNVSISNFST